MKVRAASGQARSKPASGTKQVALDVYVPDDMPYYKETEEEAAARFNARPGSTKAAAYAALEDAGTKVRASCSVYFCVFVYSEYL